MEPLTHEAKRAKEDASDHLKGFLCEKVTDPGILAVLIDRKERILMAMFTYSLTTIMNPSDDAVDLAIKRLEDNSEFKSLSSRDKYDHIKSLACGIDEWNRGLDSDNIIQAILSSAAGLNTIKHSDDCQLEPPEISKKLEWTVQKSGTSRVTSTVKAAMGYVGGIDKTVMETFTFNPAAFEGDFLRLLNVEIPSLHFAQTLNKIVVYDIKETNTLANVSPTTYTSTTEVNLPRFPLPF